MAAIFNNNFFNHFYFVMVVFFDHENPKLGYKIISLC